MATDQDTGLPGLRRDKLPTTIVYVVYGAIWIVLALGMAHRVHSRINLLSIIGIAGTLIALGAGTIVSALTRRASAIIWALLAAHLVVFVVGVTLPAITLRSLAGALVSLTILIIAAAARTRDTLNEQRFAAGRKSTTSIDFELNSDKSDAEH